MSPGETIPLQTRLWTSLKPSLLTFITRSFSLNTIVGLRPETNHTWPRSFLCHSSSIVRLSCHCPLLHTYTPHVYYVPQPMLTSPETKVKPTLPFGNLPRLVSTCTVPDQMCKFVNKNESKQKPSPHPLLPNSSFPVNPQVTLFGLIYHRTWSNRFHLHHSSPT